MKERKIVDGYELAHNALANLGYSFEISEFKNLTAESALEAANYIAGSLEGDANDALELKTFKEVGGDGFIIRDTLSFGGPSLYAEIDSETDTLTMLYANWGECLKVRFDLHAAGIEAFIPLADSLLELVAAE